MTVPRPIAESYWVEPGRLLAAEYPRSAGDTTSVDRLRRVLGAGVTLFVDLTHPTDLLQPYEPLLGRLRAESLNRDVRRVSVPVRDMSVPAPEAAAKALDTIDAELAAGGVVYLHCWGGIGRTGTIAGCWLVRHGRDGEEALRHLNELWEQNPKRSWWPEIPQTEAQADFIRCWSELDPRLGGG